MIQYFVNILPFEKRISKLRDLESEENELRIRVEDISSKLNLSNSIIKSIDSTPILEKAKSNQGDFIKELGSIHRRMKEVAAIKERLLKCEDIQKAIKQDGIVERYQKTKDLFKRNVITQKVWKESYKVLTGSGKVCYSDVIIHHCGKVLLLERSKMGKNEESKWCVPGGHVDPGEDFIQAAERELREETGIVLPEGCQLDIRGEFESDEIHIVYFEIYMQDEPTLVINNEEHKQSCWVEPRELDQYPMIFDMAHNLHAILGTGEVYVTKIEDVSKAIEEDEIEKGRKAQIGEIRQWKDGKYRRTATGWEYIKGSDPKSKGNKEENTPTLETFKELAKKSQDVKGFVEEAQKIKNVPPEVANEFFEKYGDEGSLSLEGAAKKFFEEFGKKGERSEESIRMPEKETSSKKTYVFTDTITKEKFEVSVEPHEIHDIELKNKDLKEWVQGRILTREEKKKEPSDREKSPFHNKELKRKLGNKALQAVQEGKGDEYTRTVAADYGLTFKEAVSLLAEATKLTEE